MLMLMLTLRFCLIPKNGVLAVSMKDLGDYVFVYPVGHSEEMLEYAKKLLEEIK